MRRRAGAVGGTIAGRNRRGETEHTCPGCAVTKPRTAEHFYVSVRDRATGEVLRLDNVCKPCKRAEQRDKYRTMPERRKRHLAAAQAQRQRILERRATDPEYDREWRDRVHQWNLNHRNSAKPKTPAPGGARLPSAPLAAVLEALAEIRGVEVDGPYESVCASAGIVPRQLYAWSEGDQPHVLLDVADRVLQGLDLLWWEVWAPDKHPEAVAAFGS